MRGRIDEWHIGEELLKTYNDPELLEILYHFLESEGTKNFMNLRSEAMRIPEGRRLDYLKSYFNRLMPRNDSQEFSLELLSIFIPDFREVRRTNYPNTNNVHYINEYNYKEYYAQQQLKECFSDSRPPRFMDDDFFFMEADS
ncbi:MAG: hypothetical protein GTN38_02140 [Candidatus Aenigmarchaeota archaeon]|nr:hypothetical protein [Candidatus Aenigmarchaeota archaeon]NIP40355.1 hypothetical protein [Candidatus Aenigmarchaeota archaeon]NIQ18281.1 hypothetical protein [Candidatus Aenigmarchaeota archaeon]NIS73233.1 hypothetical protein [Candidatus Aenigmarchaeota archaeon]